MRILRTFAGFSPLERRLVVQAWFTLMSARILLWVAPYQWIESRFMPPPASEPGLVAPTDIARAVTRASKLVPVATCLTQALAGALLLRRAGNNAVIHFGVAKGEAGFKAHAWLESNGGILIGGSEAASYLPLTRASDARR
jgi:hypothetical protein